jgi:hypothetical protein
MGLPDLRALCRVLFLNSGGVGPILEDRVDRHVRGADDLVWASVWTSHPAAVTPRASVAGCDSPSQCGMACPSADRGLRLGRRYLIRDRDGAYGAAFIRRIRPMDIRDRPVSARLDATGVLITSRSLASAIFATFSHRAKNTTTKSERTFRCGRAPVRRDLCRTGRVRSSPILGGLHHQYV